MAGPLVLAVHCADCQNVSPVTSHSPVQVQHCPGSVSVTVGQSRLVPGAAGGGEHLRPLWRCESPVCVL